MKKFLIAIVLVVSLIGVAFGQTVDEMDGFDWIQMTDDEAYGYLLGFYAAYFSAGARLWDEINADNGEVTPEDERMLNEYFYISLTIGDLTERIDKYYSNYDNRRHKLFMTVMFLTGKDYWNSDKFQENSPTPQSESSRS